MSNLCWSEPEERWPDSQVRGSEWLRAEGLWAWCRSGGPRGVEDNSSRGPMIPPHPRSVTQPPGARTESITPSERGFGEQAAWKHPALKTGPQGVTRDTTVGPGEGK
ncbi:hypothetical protein NDU88_001898 [Pleurodeles waltl]|uniref:Uncharacterized protein n=1 Tax=Pleurodeles waltl TaxID=8319 RepID=A0AAV7M2G0_PLEWA|nr:hypothetical protein NDU88_001898 [Pleurodeles waltl]